MARKMKHVKITGLRIKGWRDDGIVIGSDKSPQEILSEIGLSVGSSSIGTLVEIVATLPEKSISITESEFQSIWDHTRSYDQFKECMNKFFKGGV